MQSKCNRNLTLLVFPDITEDKMKHCFLSDKVVAPLGESLKMYDCHVGCQCVTPPDFTCVRYASCPLAIMALNAQKTP